MLRRKHRTIFVLRGTVFDQSPEPASFTAHITPGCGKHHCFPLQNPPCFLAKTNAQRAGLNKKTVCNPGQSNIVTKCCNVKPGAPFFRLHRNCPGIKGTRFQQGGNNDCCQLRVQIIHHRFHHIDMIRCGRYLLCRTDKHTEHIGTVGKITGAGTMTDGAHF